MLPDSPPVITRDFDGWRVSLVRGGRVHSYLCESQREAERFAGLLSNSVAPEPNRMRGAAPTAPVSPEKSKP